MNMNWFKPKYRIMKDGLDYYGLQKKKWWSLKWVDASAYSYLRAKDVEEAIEDVVWKELRRSQKEVVKELGRL